MKQLLLVWGGDGGGVGELLAVDVVVRRSCHASVYGDGLVVGYVVVVVLDVVVAT